MSGGLKWSGIAAIAASEARNDRVHRIRLIAKGTFKKIRLVNCSKQKPESGLKLQRQAFFSLFSTA